MTHVKTWWPCWFRFVMNALFSPLWQVATLVNSLVDLEYFNEVAGPSQPRTLGPRS